MKAIRQSGGHAVRRRLPLRAAAVSAAVLLASMVIALPAAARGSSSSSSASSSATGWTGQALPWTVPGHLDATVNDVTCLSTTSCIGVGAVVSDALVVTLVGGGWTDTAVPVPAGDSSASLAAVTCRSATACTAVGSVVDDGSTLPLVAVSTGGSWSADVLAAPGASPGSLAAVTCASSTSCVAVGRSGSSALIETLAAGNWTSLTRPAPAGDDVALLSAVACPSTALCLAVGTAQNESGGQLVSRGLVATDAAGSWTTTTLDPAAGKNGGTLLNGLTCTGRAACLAVGSSAGQSLVDKWHRGKWKATTGIDPTTAGGTLAAVSCTSAAHCLAVGGENVVESFGEVDTPLTETLVHGHWTAAEEPALPFDAFSQASCVSTHGCVAVSGDAPLFCPAPGDCTAVPGATAIATLTATGWASVSLAGPPDAALTDVSCPGTGTCTAVGNYDDATGTEHVAVETLAGGTWTPVTVDLQALYFTLPSVSCVGSDCVIVSGDTVASSSGGPWTVTTVPADPDGHVVNLVSVSCATATACVAVGDPAGLGDALVAATLSSGSWTTADLPVAPATGGGNLAAVDCLAATSCVAVGSADGTSGQAALVESLSGTTWTPTLVTAPSGDDGGQLDSVTCAVATVASCVAVGSTQSTAQTLSMTATLSGTTWTTAAGYAGGDPSTLTGVACATAASCVALGSDTSGAPAAPLALALSGGTWTSVPVTLPAGSVSGLLDNASCPTSCLGVGADVQPWSTLPGYDATYPLVATDS